MSPTGNVLFQSILRTLVPIIVGAVLGWFASAGIEVDPEFESALTVTLTAAGTALYYIAFRVLEVYVSPKFGLLLGSKKSPDGYSEGAPPVGQAEDGDEDQGEYGVELDTPHTPGL